MFLGNVNMIKSRLSNSGALNLHKVFDKTRYIDHNLSFFVRCKSGKFNNFPTSFDQLKFSHNVPKKYVRLIANS